MQRWFFGFYYFSHFSPCLLADGTG